MELGRQIKKYRNELSLSQDALAERVYVSRQTISNWENNKSYPDVNSLILLSEIFQTSIDDLIKGDIEVMKEEVKSEERKEFKKLSSLYAILFLAMVVSPIPLAHYLGDIGIVIWITLMVVTLVTALKVEKKKKDFNIQTYKEIIAFTEGKKLDKIDKTREEGKKPYQKVLLAIGSAFIALVVTALLMLLLK